MNTESLLLLLQSQIIQIILLSFVGALLGETRKEMDDTCAIEFSKFIVRWISSGFCGIMVGLLLKGMIKDNESIVLGGSGIAGFAGYKLSTRWVGRWFEKQSSKENKDEEE